MKLRAELFAPPPHSVSLTHIHTNILTVCSMQTGHWEHWEITHPCPWHVKTCIHVFFYHPMQAGRIQYKLIGSPLYPPIDQLQKLIIWRNSPEQYSNQFWWKIIDALWSYFVHTHTHTQTEVKTIPCSPLGWHTGYRSVYHVYLSFTSGKCKKPFWYFTSCWR